MYRMNDDHEKEGELMMMIWMDGVSEKEKASFKAYLPRFCEFARRTL